MDLISVRLDQIEAKLDRLIDGPPSDIVGVAEAMRLAGAKTARSLHRAFIKLGVKPYARGKYRRLDITNAIGLRVLHAQKKT